MYVYIYIHNIHSVFGSISSQDVKEVLVEMTQASAEFMPAKAGARENF